MLLLFLFCPSLFPLLPCFCLFIFATPFMFITLCCLLFCFIIYSLLLSPFSFAPFSMLMFFRPSLLPYYSFVFSFLFSPLFPPRFFLVCPLLLFPLFPSLLPLLIHPCFFFLASPLSLFPLRFPSPSSVSFSLRLSLPSSPVPRV